MIEPNRLTDPAERAACERVEVLFAAIDDLSNEQLSSVVVEFRDPDEREQLLATLGSVAAARRRTPLLEEALSAVRGALQAKASFGVPVGTYGITTTSSSRVEDRVAVAAAIDDAVAVAVTEDLLEPDVAARLADPGRSLLGLDPLPGGATDAGADRRATPAWEPSPDDRREAEQGAGVEPDASLPGVRTMRVAFFAVVAVIGAAAAIAGGLVNDELLFGILAAVAIVALCWTFATFRRAT